MRQSGGLNAFMYNLVSDANAIARAHVRLLGGNALLGYRMLPRESTGGANRNSAYTLVSVSGDIVEIDR